MTLPGPPLNPFDGLTRALTNMTEALAAISLIPNPIITAEAFAIPAEPSDPPPTPGRFRNLL